VVNADPIHPDPIITAATARLSLMAVLAAAKEVEFTAARDAGGLTDSAASAEVTTLEAVGYLTRRNGHVGRRPAIWLSLTEAGRAALRHHIAALRQIVDAANA
jgi:DNA-binding MarR family transcriptional regulator